LNPLSFSTNKRVVVFSSTLERKERRRRKRRKGRRGLEPKSGSFIPQQRKVWHVAARCFSLRAEKREKEEESRIHASSARTRLSHLTHQKVKDAPKKPGRPVQPGLEGKRKKGGRKKKGHIVAEEGVKSINLPPLFVLT